MQVVLGYGNTMRGDDGFGPAVIARLEEKARSMSSVQFLSSQQLLPEFAEVISGASLAIFIDASGAHPPGEISCRTLSINTARAAEMAEILPHALSPEILLSLAAHVCGSAPPAFLYTAGGQSFDVGDKLTPPVAEAVDQVADLVLARLESLHRL